VASPGRDTERCARKTAQTNAGYAAFSVSRVAESTSQGVNAVRAAATYPAIADPLTARARRYAGQAALAHRSAFRACAAANASGALTTPYSGAISSG
jgi:hypothetical protein